MNIEKIMVVNLFVQENFLKNKFTIVTVELESWYIKEKIKSGIDVKLLDLNEYSKARIG